MPIGLQPYNYQPAYGGIPQLTNPTATASSAISGNLANLPQLQGLVSGINPQYTRQQDIIGQELAGQVPQDVVNQLAQQAAERGIAIGSPGSPNSLANYLTRFLGTSYGIQRQGMSEANTLGQLTEEMMRPYMVSAADQQAAEAMQSIYNAAPVPSEAAKAAEDAIRRAYDLYGRDMIAGAGGAGGRPGYAIGPTPYSGRPQPFTGAINYPQVAMGATPGTYESPTAGHANQNFNALTGTWYTPARASGPQTTPFGGDVMIPSYTANLGTGGSPYDPMSIISGGFTGSANQPDFTPWSPYYGGVNYNTPASDPYYALDTFSPEWMDYMGYGTGGGTDSGTDFANTLGPAGGLVDTFTSLFE